MEGSWRGLLAWLAATAVACALMLGATACGDDDSGAAGTAGVKTGDPLRTFAPLIRLAAGEPWQPMSVRWFVERSIFRFAEDEGCADRKIAVGRTLPEQWTEEFDWIYPKGLGGWSWPAYYRNPYDAKCENDFDLRFYADQLTRPYDPGVRVEGIRPGEGFYLDLVDAARSGPREGTAPVYAERTDEGDGGVRLTYWMLFGMHGTPGEPGAHEGDWQRVDVLLRDLGDDRYGPEAVQVGGTARDTAWRAALRVDETRPVVRLARGTHDATVMAPGEDCSSCVAWDPRNALVDARRELWYGFGGAWGEVGTDSASTGPLGPHRFFPSTSEKLRQLQEQAEGAGL